MYSAQLKAKTAGQLVHPNAEVESSAIERTGTMADIPSKPEVREFLDGLIVKLLPLAPRAIEYQRGGRRA